MPSRKLFKFPFLVILLLSSSFLLSACGKKEETTIEPTPTPRLVELSDSQKPLVSLTPRADGHELKLIIDNLDSIIKKIEYELIYRAEDEDMVIEKGLGDGISPNGQQKIERDLLLGTSSCTNECKYKYDDGVTGGTLSLTLTTEQNQVAYFETPFSLLSSKDFEKNKLSLEGQIDVTASGISSGFYLLHQTFGGDRGYLLTSSGQGSAKTFSVKPETITPPDQLTGLYLAN